MNEPLNKPPIPESCWPDERQALLLKAALMDGDEARSAFDTWITRVNIDALDYASYRMIPLLYGNLSRLGVRHSEMNRLKGISRYHWMKNQVVMREVPALLFAMHQAGIPTMLLKGLALIERYYFDASLRPMNDIDLLVPYDDAVRAADVMIAAGWTPMYPADLDALRRSSGARIRNGMCFVNEKKIECDLHWSVLHDSTWRDADETFWKNAEPVIYAGEATHFLCPTDQLLHTCLHGGRFNEFHPMRWIGDAVYILRKDARGIDWDMLIDSGRYHHMLLVLRSALHLLACDYNVPVPVSALEKMDRMKPSRMESIRYRLITERTEGLVGLARRDWYQHCASSPRQSTLTHAITFPAYLKSLWRIESWWKLPGYIGSRVLYRAGLAKSSPRIRGG